MKHCQTAKRRKNMEEVNVPEKRMLTEIGELIPIEEAVKIFESVQKPPEDALKPIDAGRLKGKNEISPLWRMKAMTEKFGLYGDGWKYEVHKEWKEPVEATGETIVQVSILLYTRNRRTGEWNAPSPATGSAYLIVKDKNGLHGNENAWASAFTDAFGKACKPYGIGYDVYLGKTNRNNDNGGYNNGYNNYNRNNNYNNYNNRNNYQNQGQTKHNNQPQQAPQNNQPAQPAAPAQPDQKKEILHGIMENAKKMNIPNETIQKFIMENFNGKKSTKEMTLQEVQLLDKNLEYFWEKEKKGNKPA